jgi:histidine ammonia-lyase
VSRIGYSGARTSPACVEIGAPPLTIDMVDAVARRNATVSIAPAARRGIERSYAFMLQVVRDGVPVYGLTTGCGPLATRPVSPGAREAFQRNLIRSHATTLGAPLPVAFVRAAMTVRAHVLARGYSGVHPDAVSLLAGMLNARIHPVVREVGSVGASGDLVELAEIARAMIGEGTVEYRGVPTAAAAALRDAGLDPLVPRHREGIALINGTSCHTGAAAVLVARARRVAHAGTVAAAMLLEALQGNLEAFDGTLQAVRGHAGQQSIARDVIRLVRGSRLLRTDEPSAARQDAYTLRCIPQVLGTVADEIAAAATVVTTELDAVTDNPLFVAAEGRVIHGGNFHGQPVAMALDRLKAAAVELGVASERRVARVLDATLSNGLPPFLVSGDAGPQSGLMGLQYCSSSMAADNAVLAAPASVRSVPTNANNQDVVSMGMVAARQAARVLDNVERMVAIELLCAAQALDLRGAAQAGAGTSLAFATIRRHVAPIVEDRPLGEDVEALCRVIDAGELDSAVGTART